LYFIATVTATTVFIATSLRFQIGTGKPNSGSSSTAVVVVVVGSVIIIKGKAVPSQPLDRP
jgi:hypothetical protein